MKLSRLKSVVNQALRESTGNSEGYLIDPFYHRTPEMDIEIDLITGKFTTDMEGDDVERYYRAICEWFHKVLPKEGIPIDIIDKAVIKISPQGKKCIIQAKGREFSATLIIKLLKKD
jgi:hypothetical protein